MRASTTLTLVRISSAVAIQLKVCGSAFHRRVLGDDHPDTLTSASNLAANLRGLGEHQQARELNEDTLTRLRCVLGDYPPDPLRSASNLAAALEALGEQEQAHRWRSWAARDHRTQRKTGSADDAPRAGRVP